MKQNRYFGRSLISYQASSVSILHFAKRVGGGPDSGSSPAIEVPATVSASSKRGVSSEVGLAYLFQLGSRIIKISTTDIAAMTRAGTQYCYSMVILRVIENRATIPSSPRTRPRVAKLIMRPRDSDLT